MKKPNTIFIDKEYLALVPRPTDEQRQLLKESIKENGLLNPIIINENGKVLDGHTRFDICSELNIIPELEVKKFDDINKEREFVVISNLKRRHLNTFQIIELSQSLRRHLNDETKASAVIKREQAKRGEIPSQSAQERLENSTRYKMAKITGLSPSTVDKANYIIDHASKIELEQVRSGKISLEQSFRQLVNERHKDPSLVVRNTHVYPNCKKCGSKTRFKGKCHVHKKYCCRNCEYGE